MLPLTFVLGNEPLHYLIDTQYVLEFSDGVRESQRPVVIAQGNSGAGPSSIRSHRRWVPYTVHRYTAKQFYDTYGYRGIEEVHVDVPNEAGTLLYIDRVECGGPWNFNLVTNNCDAFATYAIEQGGGQITSDGSHGENPRKFPRDARDGFKKQNEKKRQEKEKENKNNKLSIYPGSIDFRSLMYSRLLENLEDFR